MSAPFTILVPLTDLRWFTDSPDVGDPACLCSWCGKVIERGVPIRMYREIGPGEALEGRFHDACCEPVLGWKVQSFDSGEGSDDDNDEYWANGGYNPDGSILNYGKDEDNLCYCHGDEYGHDPDPLGVFHVSEQVLDRARMERGEAPPDVDLGACCACRERGATVRNIMMLDKRAPVPGTGWGCVVCGLPTDGAIAVVCDACLEAKRPILDVCVGYATVNERISIALVTGVFEHNLAMHGDEVHDGQ